MQELDTLVIDHPTAVIDHPTAVIDDPTAGRHRAAPSAARRLGTRLSLSAAALFAVAALGWVTADAVGLTSADAPSAAEFPAGSLRADADDPRPARAVDLTPRPTPPLVEPPAPEAGSSAPEAGTVSPTVRAPQATVEPSPVGLVKVGDTCSSPGAAGVTAKGKRAVCTSGEGPTRWKHA